MECNRDEALRAKEVAERKFASKDYVGARKFALKAQQLFPSLENISQIIAVMDVHVAAQTGGGPDDEKDWYGILQVDPTADDASIKKQYRKLALFLHPDKNKSIGAESAFKLIGEALQVLSDESKRIAYDAKRGLHSNASAGNTNHRAHAAANGHGPSQKPQRTYPDGNTHFNMKVRHHHPPQAPPASTVHYSSHLLTFWTACSSCQMRYQYLRKYENQNLLCPHCRNPFIAKDLSNVLKVNVAQSWPPQADETTVPGAQSWRSSPYTSTDFRTTTGFNCYGSSTNGKHDGIINPGSTMASDASAKNKAGINVSGCDTGVARSKAEAERELYRKIEELQKARKIQKELTKKAKAAETLAKSMANQWRKAEATLTKSTMKNELFSAEVRKTVGCVQPNEGGDQVTTETGRTSCGCKRASSYSSTKSDEDLQDTNPCKKPRTDAADCVSTKDSLTDADMFKRLAEIAKKAIRMQLSLQASKAPKPAAASFPPTRPEEKLEKKQQSCGSEMKKEEVTAISSSVPDADFHNFDESREEKDVEVGQIWALYDDKDGMPKYYVKVKEVRSRRPFKVLIGWFEPRKLSEEVRELLDMGFSLTCGEFRITASQMLNSVNSFSHLVNWEKGGGKGMIKIYPKKSEVWAIYEDWEPGQQMVKVTSTEDDDAPSPQCCMVEVVSDLDDEATGLSVMQLRKVQGFKTVFQRANEKALQVPFTEMLRFSHRVPAHKLNGGEAPGIIPNVCWELDPAAVPLCLLDPDSKAGFVKTGD